MCAYTNVATSSCLQRMPRTTALHSPSAFELMACRHIFQSTPPLSTKGPKLRLPHTRRPLQLLRHTAKSLRRRRRRRRNAAEPSRVQHLWLVDFLVPNFSSFYIHTVQARLGPPKAQPNDEQACVSHVTSSSSRSWHGHWTHHSSSSSSKSRGFFFFFFTPLHTLVTSHKKFN